MNCFKRGHWRSYRQGQSAKLQRIARIGHRLSPMLNAGCHGSTARLATASYGRSSPGKVVSDGETSAAAAGSFCPWASTARGGHASTAVASGKIRIWIGGDHAANTVCGEGVQLQGGVIG